MTDLAALLAKLRGSLPPVGQRGVVLLAPHVYEALLDVVSVSAVYGKCCGEAECSCGWEWEQRLDAALSRLAAAEVGP